MPTIGNTSMPTGGADDYPSGFVGSQRLQMPADGYITKIFAWVSTSNISGAAFRLFADSGSSSAPGARLFYAPSDIPLTATGGNLYSITLSSPVFLTAGSYFWLGGVDVSGEVAFMYQGASGSLIYDAFYGGGSVPPPDPMPGGELSFYSGDRYGFYVEYETSIGGTSYSAKSVANIAASGVTKTILGLRQKSAAAGIISGGSKTQFSFNQKSPGGILLAGAAKLRLISKNFGVGLVGFSGVSKARFISSYFGVGASVVTGYSKASLQINTVTLSVVSSGALNLSGAAKLRSIYSQKSASQLSVSGISVPRFAVRSASSGVIALGGLTRTVYRFVGKSVGQFSANGFSKNRFVFKAASVSGSALSGASKIRQITSYVGVGAGVIGGYSKATLALGVASISIVSAGNLVLSGKSQITLLPAIDWFQNFSLTVYYKPRDRTVRAIPFDRTVKFRF